MTDQKTDLKKLEEQSTENVGDVDQIEVSIYFHFFLMKFLQALNVTTQDFEQAIKKVQPSAKREG